MAIQEGLFKNSSCDRHCCQDHTCVFCFAKLSLSVTHNSFKFMIHSSYSWCRFASVLVLLLNASYLLAQDYDWYDNPDNWQFGSDNYWVCTKLVNDSAKTRYADGTPVSASSAYNVTSAMTSDQCGYGWVRLDHREILEVRDSSGAVVQQLVWHKGGQDYERPQPPYGWLDINDIKVFDGALAVPTAQNVPRREGTQPETEGMAPIGLPLVSGQPLSYGAPYWNSGEDKWDTTRMLGKGCVAEENILYHYKMVPTSDPDGIPRGWQYKKFTTSSRYNKYADGGENYGDGTAEYAWLMWNFLTHADGETKVGGGGQMRGLIKNGQEFHRCIVKSIIAKAWGYDSDKQVGEITAWYVKTRGNPYSPWMYGWMIAEHRMKNQDGSFGPSILHYDVASITFAANAGPDRTVYTSSDSAEVELSASASTGNVDSYSWYINGSTVAYGESPKIALPIGMHDIILIVTDNSGAVSEDIQIISVQTAPAEYKYEAEAAIISSGNVKSGGTGEYVDLQSDGSIQWDVPVYEDGRYELAFSIAVPSGGTRSMGVFADGIKVGVVSSNASEFSENSVTTTLKPENAIIELKDTEGTAELNVDYLIVKYLGPASSFHSERSFYKDIRIYPNPIRFNHTLFIDLGEYSPENCIVEIYNIEGIRVYHKVFNYIDNCLEIDNLNLADSLYIVRVVSDERAVYRKLVCKL